MKIVAHVFLLFLSVASLASEVGLSLDSSMNQREYKPIFEGRSIIPPDEIPTIWDILKPDDVQKEKIPRYRGGGGQPYGCVTGDTRIVLENGEEAYMKDVSRGDIFLNQFGDRVAAYYTLRGPEKHSMIKISTVFGKSIVATKGHPFYSREGLSRADEFEKDGEILTKDGYERVLKTEKLSFSGDVYNLALSPVNLVADRTLEKRDPFLNLTSAEHTVILNGFISGDIILQNLIVKK